MKVKGRKTNGPAPALKPDRPAHADALIDARGRALRDLRISVTDRCNFRCVYCMPREVFGADHAFLDRKEVLSLEEIARIAALFVEQGVRKIRLTGGEPLVRRGLETLVEQLAAIPGIEDLSLTTNGSLLTPARAHALRDAGLGRVTVSLDALDDAVFKRINDVNFPVSGVLRAIDAAADAQVWPRSKSTWWSNGAGTENQIVPMARHFRGTGHIVRFIEYMDVGNSNGWELADVVSAREIVERIDARYPLDPVGANYPGEVAKRWRYRDGTGEIGVIASVSQPFCGGLHARASLGRRAPVHMPLRNVPATTFGRRFAPAPPTKSCEAASRASGAAATIATPSSAPPPPSSADERRAERTRRGGDEERRAGRAGDAQDRDVLYRRLRCPAGLTRSPPPAPVSPPDPGSGRPTRRPGR